MTTYDFDETKHELVIAENRKKNQQIIKKNKERIHNEGNKERIRNEGKLLTNDQRIIDNQIDILSNDEKRFKARKDINNNTLSFFLLIFCLLVVLIGGVLLYFFVIKKKKKENFEKDKRKKRIF